MDGRHARPAVAGSERDGVTTGSHQHERLFNAGNNRETCDRPGREPLGARPSTSVPPGPSPHLPSKNPTGPGGVRSLFGVHRRGGRELDPCVRISKAALCNGTHRFIPGAVVPFKARRSMALSPLPKLDGSPHARFAGAMCSNSGSSHQRRATHHLWTRSPTARPPAQSIHDMTGVVVPRSLRRSRSACRSAMGSPCPGGPFRSPLGYC